MRHERFEKEIDSSPMRVIHFVESLKGGPATYLNELLPFQVRAYEHVAVLCPEGQAQFITCDGVEVIPFSETGRGPLGIAKLLAYWVRYAASNNYDVLHLHSTFAGLAGRLAPRMGHARLVYCPHGWSFAMDSTPAKRRIYAFVERLLAHRTDAIINISASEETIATRVGIPKAKSALIHNGISDAKWSPLPEGRQPSRLLFVGRYDRQKGVDILIEAMRELAPLGYTLTMIGGSVISTPILGHLPPGVTDLGWRKPQEIQDAMAEADVVVMPSRWEGFGYVGVEAMRAGRPLIASAVGGLEELVIDNQTGILCAPNSVSALINAILRLSQMNTRTLGINARLRYEAFFTAERMFQQLEAVYRERA